MTGNRLIFYILAAFIAGTLMLVYMQYNSAKNINLLIVGNQKLVEEFKVEKELQELLRDLLSVESKIRSTITSQNETHVQGVKKQIATIEQHLATLRQVPDYESSAKNMNELSKLVTEKLAFGEGLIAAYDTGGKLAAERLMATMQERELSDSIASLVQIIENTRKSRLTDISVNIEHSGKKAQQFSVLLIMLVLVLAGGLFWYIIHIIRKQVQLIDDLHLARQKVEKAAQVKENFMANMSHEIRTPMNAILGFTHLLQRQKLQAPANEYVQTIEQSGENLLAIINDILDISKIEAGMMRIESAPFSLTDVAMSVKAMFKDKATERGLELTTILDPKLPAMVEGDATRITQILINLVSNALKFTNEGTINVHIYSNGQQGQILSAVIKVVDTGIGIANDKLSAIFDRFQQADDATTRRFGGTGLGLSIVNDLVHLQNGTVSVSSQPGKGTTFIIELPLKISAENIASEALPGEATTTLPLFNHNNVLVVEDNEINQSLLRHLFGEWQLSADMVGNGQEAINLLHQKNYDLVLMDIQMPVMDGYATTVHIRQAMGLHIPIIAMTAHALAGEREKCINYGMNDYISKPLREAQLHRLITRYTSNHNIPVATLHGRAKPHQPYAFIDLTYMKEVSNGNTDYEKLVTDQFIKAIPKDLNQLQLAWSTGDVSSLRHLAHNLKTTISVMGLNNALQPLLDTLEYETLNEALFQQTFKNLSSYLDGAVSEASALYPLN